MATLMNSSHLVKSYELLIQQFENEFDVKNGKIRDLEKEMGHI